MADLPSCVLVVMAEIDAAVEEEWNRWYDEVHLPQALACPGVIAGKRYRAAGPAATTEHGAKSSTDTRTYLALYELESPAAMETPEFHAMRGWYQFSDRIKARTQVFAPR